tara:strand:- start:9307 stop:10047 length:741 start_codon:yes stop_codon:yes gene_type:complete
MKKENLDADPQSMDNRRLGAIARNPNHPQATHAKAELARRKVKKSEMDEGGMKRIATTQSNKADRMASGGKKGLETFKKKVNEVSSKTLSNYMRKSTASAGKPRQDVRTMDKRIGGQKMADDKLRKMDGKGSAAKVAATKEANTYVGQRDQMKITGRKPHPDGGHIVTLQTKAGKTIKRHLKNGKVKDIKETQSVNELSKDTMQSYWDKTKGDDAFSGSRKANNRLKGAINVTTKLDRIKKMVKKK